MVKKDKKNEPVDDSDESNSENDSGSESGSESESNVSSKKGELAKLKFMNKLFPSKHLSNKISSLTKNKNKKNDEEEKTKPKNDKKSNENICLKRCKQNKKCNQKKKRRVVSEDDTETSSDVWADESDDNSSSESENNIVSYQKKRGKKIIEESESSFSDDEEEEEEEEPIKNSKKKNALPFNIVLEFGAKKNRNSASDDYDDEDSYWEEISEEDEDINGIDTEDEDEPVSSDSDDDDESLPKGSNLDSIQASKKENEDLLIQLQNIPNKNKSILKCIEMCKSEIETCKKQMEKKTKKHREKNSRIFRKIIRDKNAMNDVDFFNKLNMEEQKKIIKELREINKVTRIEKPYRMSLLESNIPVQFKAAAMKKINLLRGMDPDCGEYYKIKNWVDTFMRMPFGKYESLNVSYEDGVERCHEFMAHAQKTLDQAVYGLNDAKMQIMQMLGQLITNPKALGAAIAIHGPPGTGALKCTNYFLLFSCY